MSRLVAFSDVLCPWATVIALRLHAARARGTPVCNPGTTMAWIGGRMPRATPVLVDDDPVAYDRLVAEALLAPVG
jgi:hypothetical protein